MIEANSGDGPNEVTPAGCSNGALLACCKAQTSGCQLPIFVILLIGSDTKVESILNIIILYTCRVSACRKFGFAGKSWTKDSTA